MKTHFFFMGLIFLTVACSKQDPTSIPKPYEGPMQTAENIVLYYSENNQVKVKLEAAKEEEYENGDREFPEGIFIQFYDESGNASSTMTAKSAHFSNEEQVWQAKGKVEVKNFAKNEQLNTEELFWKPSDKKIHTDKFVTIRSEDGLINGTGMEANEDFTEHKIFHVIDSEFYIDE